MSHKRGAASSKQQASSSSSSSSKPRRIQDAASSSRRAACSATAQLFWAGGARLERAPRPLRASRSGATSDLVLPCTSAKAVAAVALGDGHHRANPCNASRAAQDGRQRQRQRQRPWWGRDAARCSARCGESVCVWEEKKYAGGRQLAMRYAVCAWSAMPCHAMLPVAGGPMSDVRRKPAGEPQIGERLDAGLLLHGELYWPGTPRLRTERATVMP